MGLFLCSICGSKIERIKRDGLNAKYCSHKCYSKSGDRKKGRSPRKRRVEISKYWYVMRPTHPRANKKGYVPEAVVIAEKILDRELTGDETVHHKNHDSLDNRPENLAIMTVHQHLSYHAKEKHKKAGGKRWKKER